MKNAIRNQDLKALQQKFHSKKYSGYENTQVVKYQPDKTIKIRTRHAMATTLIFDSEIDNFVLGDQTGFKIEQIPSQPNAIAIIPQLIGIDTSLTIFTSDGKIHTFYIFSTDYKNSSDPSFIVRIKDGETQKAKLAKLGDVYVNDAFGTAHRAHASTTVLAKFFPKDKYFGYLLAKEIESIEKVMKTGERPVTAILGGSKVSSKITIIENILDKIDHLIIGGGMAFTFIKAQGGQIGNSICEDDKLDLALDILKKAKEKGVQVHLPVDVVAANDFNNNASTQVVAIDQIPNGWQGLDAGEKSLENFKKVILASRTILWNGPVGVFEMPRFAKGTIAVGEYVAEATAKGAFSLVGGGDSVAAVKQFGFENKVSYVSTGGGAMLESLEGKILPGIRAINE